MDDPRSVQHRHRINETKRYLFEGLLLAKRCVQSDLLMQSRTLDVLHEDVCATVGPLTVSVDLDYPLVAANVRRQLGLAPKSLLVARRGVRGKDLHDLLAPIAHALVDGEINRAHAALTKRAGHAP